MVALETNHMPKGIPLTRNELEQRRREIFDASVHLFLENGFYETSMREVAEAAGIGKSTLYDYFPNKDEIIVYAIENSIKNRLNIFFCRFPDRVTPPTPIPGRFRQTLSSIWADWL